MGCNTCKSECGREDGCGSRKADQKLLLDSLIERLYPTRRWGEPDPRACLEDGLAYPEVVTLARRLATVLRAPTYVLRGGDDDLCTFIYVLCLGREPSLLELRESVEPLWLESDSLRERYLRVACSTVGRLACVQEVAMELHTSDSSCPPGLALIRELAMPGVFEPMLLKRLQKSVDLLLAHSIEHLDLGLLDVDAAAFGLLPGDYEERFGMAPALLNYLFYAMPVTTATDSFLPLPATVQAALASPAVASPLS
jgi:hypothetical protein